MKAFTDTQIADRARKQLKQLERDYKEMNDLRSAYKIKAEWHKEMLKIVSKEMMLKEILGIDED